MRNGEGPPYNGLLKWTKPKFEEIEYTKELPPISLRGDRRGGVADNAIKSGSAELIRM